MIKRVRRKMNKIKIIHLIIACDFVLMNYCQGQNDNNSSNKYFDQNIAVDKNNVPIDSNQYYFPLSLFTETDYVLNYDDSLVVASAKTLDELDKIFDSKQLIAVINPNQYDTALVKWYSKFLFSMREPLLFNKKIDKEIFRFTWLRTFDNPIVIRIEKIGEDYRIYWKVSNGYGGYYPGKLIVDKERTIDKKDWEKFQKSVEGIDYWKENNLQELLGLDGSHWILEGATPEKYHVVDEWSPNEQDGYYQACNLLLTLTRLKIKSDEKY